MDDYLKNERRKSRRFPFREDIVIDGLKSCSSYEISKDGLFVSALQNFEEGKVIKVTIPFGREQITVKAQVIFSQPSIGMGVRFVDLNDEQKEKIKELVERISGRSS